MTDLAQQYRTAVLTDDTAEIDRVGALLDAQTAAEQDRLTRPGALFAAALWYAEAGTAVFPLEPRGKKPITRNGFKDASCNREQIAAWWTATPDANIGTPTGVDFDVIDVDGHTGVLSCWGSNGFADSLPPLLAHSMTSRDGGHHLFVPVAGQRNAAGLFPGIDYRGAGGYVVIPPSVGANGRRYTWVAPPQFHVNAAAA